MSACDSHQHVTHTTPHGGTSPPFQMHPCASPRSAQLSATVSLRSLWTMYCCAGAEAVTMNVKGRGMRSPSSLPPEHTICTCLSGTPGGSVALTGPLGRPGPQRPDHPHGALLWAPGHRMTLVAAQALCATPHRVRSGRPAGPGLQRSRPNWGGVSAPVSDPFHHQASTTNRHQPPTINGHQRPTANRHQPATTNGHRPPTANRQPPTAAADRQPLSNAVSVVCALPMS